MANELAYHILVVAIAAGVVTVLGLIGTQSRPDHRGWRKIKLGAMHWTGIGLGAPLTCLFAYVWLFVGSSRADAEQQMTILFWLIVAFGLVTIIVGVSMFLINKKAVRWRRQTIAFASKGQTEKRKFEEIVTVHTTMWGRVDLRFHDGTLLWLDPYAKGAPELIEAISNYIESSEHLSGDGS